ncbi:MAG: hypothetical protein JW703_02425 [Candidatus Diapherotrites archaeon]|nr:hypothetical protein [Candidatus Diapherotrites archaeon]
MIKRIKTALNRVMKKVSTLKNRIGNKFSRNIDAKKSRLPSAFNKYAECISQNRNSNPEKVIAIALTNFLVERKMFQDYKKINSIVENTAKRISILSNKYSEFYNQKLEELKTEIEKQTDYFNAQKNELYFPKKNETKAEKIRREERLAVLEKTNPDLNKLINLRLNEISPVDSEFLSWLDKKIILQERANLKVIPEGLRRGFPESNQVTKELNELSSMLLINRNDLLKLVEISANKKKRIIISKTGYFGDKKLEVV